MLKKKQVFGNCYFLHLQSLVDFYVYLDIADSSFSCQSFDSCTFSTLAPRYVQTYSL